ncbi:MarR family winged helix-turn-helix transcriptional regulator [Sphingomonas sp. 37zxx]|uniref:MarR family winged helix-turn-helix transcriptional regulator n=1 Tax=Sphingomonas sp. 37zxx TaxID=1550073 RepID=UPI000A764DD1|nr:MarR family transcriptional regulator [Sphingomonas sp. 37zxx]
MIRLKEAPELEGLLGYQVQLAWLKLDNNARDVLAPFDISPARLTALVMVRDNPGCGQTTLGRALSINRSSAMKLVNALEGRGWVERQAGRDLRSNGLYLTAAGEQAIAAMIDALRESEDQLVQPLSHDELNQLLMLLAKFRRGPPRPARVARTG